MAWRRVWPGAALDQARAANLRVIQNVAGIIAAYIRRHPTYQDLVPRQQAQHFLHRT